MATYVNNLRLTELATGEGSGTWGTTTNTSLELIGEALGYNTQDCFSSDADATTTVADGATDPARAFYFKVTSSATLTATRTLTIAPNTISRVMFIENATTGSQSITISQGSGANVTIATGKTAVVYLDGAGATAAVVDAMANVDPGVTDTLAEVLAAGNTSGGTGLTMSSGDDLTLTGASYNAVWDSSDNSLEFSDNARAVFGASNDLLIYHDGSNSYISETGTGSLRIRSNQIRLEAPDSQNMVIVTEDAGVQAFYNGTERLTVTNTGIDVTGTAVTDGLTVDGATTVRAGDSSTPSVESSAGDLVLKAGADDVILQTGGSGGEAIQFIDSAGALYFNADMETGDITFYDTDGSTASFVYDASAGLTINEAGADRDFRVESDSNTHALFLNAGNDRVAISTASPQALFHVEGDQYVVTDSGVAVNGIHVASATAAADGTYGGAISFDTGSLGSSGIAAVNDGPSDTDSNGLAFFTHGSGTGGADAVERMRISYAGDISFYEDTGTTEKFIWSASSERLTLKTSGTYALDVQASATTSATIAQFTNSAGSDKAYIALDSTGAGKLVLLDGGNNEDVLIAANSHSYYNTGGNFYFGKTSGDLSTDGVEARAVGLLGATRTSNPPLVLRRNTDDGTIISLSKDATEIGALGSNSGGLFIADDDTGLFFNRASNNILPYRNDSGNEGPYTNALDLGRSTARFKDAYLRSVDITNDSDRGRIRLYANASLGGEMRLFNANGYGLISMINDHTLNFHTNNTERLELSSSLTVFNDVSEDVDFRVESNNNANMLFLDAGNDSVNIGDSDGSLATLQVRGEVGGSIFRLFSGTSYQGLQFQGTTSLGNGTVEIVPVTIPGSGTANQYTYFNKITSGGTTKHHVVVENSFQVDDGEAVFNQSGGDNDFRVESDNNANMLFVDAGNDAVGIGAAPLANSELTIYADDPVLTLRDSKTGSSWVAGDGLGQLEYFTSDGTGIADHAVARIKAINGGTASAAPDGVLIFETAGYNVQAVERMRIGNSDTAAGVTINETGANQDFRVESDGNANMLFVDASGNQVGVGKNPSNTFDVNGSASFGTTSTNNSIVLNGKQDGTVIKFNAGGSHRFDLDCNGTGTDSLSFNETNATKLFTIYRSSEIVVNEDSLSTVDFRVESDSNTHMLFVDAGINSVAINASNPFDDEFRVATTANFVTSTGTDPFYVTRTGGYDQALQIYVDDTNVYFDSIQDEVGLASGGYYFRSSNGTNDNQNLLIMNQTGTTFNEPGLDIDFRVESDSNAYGFFLDASTTSVGVNHTSSPGGYAQFVVRFSGSDSNVNTTGVAIQDSGTNSNISFCTFFNSSGGGIGSITRVGTTNAVNYNTTSDRRAKENIADADDAGAIIDAIQVRKFDWIEGNQHQPYGMIAQELVEHAPEVVHQPADEEDMMGVDYSKLVPMLIKEIQSLRARVAQLESN